MLNKLISIVMFLLMRCLNLLKKEVKYNNLLVLFYVDNCELMSLLQYCCQKYYDTRILVEKVSFDGIKIFIKCVSYPSTKTAGGGEVLNKKIQTPNAR